MIKEYVQIKDGVVTASFFGLDSPGDGWTEMPGWSAIAMQRPTSGTYEYRVADEAWVVIPPTTSELATAARAERTRRLAASDWTQLPDVPEATRSAWNAYRQALRDITSQPTFPEFVDWPTPPQ